MTDFDFPFAQYTRESYISILNQLRGGIPNQTEGLSKLSDLLTYGSQERLIEFPIEEFAHEILHILNTTANENLAMLSSKCVFGLLEAHTRSTSALLNNNGLQVLASHLLNCKWIETSEFCIQSLYIISKYRAIDLEITIGLNPLLKIIEKFPITIQRSAIKAVVNVTDKDITKEMTNYIPKLLELSKYTDEQIQKSSIKAINNIASRVMPEDLDPKTTALLCQSAPVFIDALINLSCSLPHISQIIRSNIDFEKIFKEVENAEKQTSILKLILNLLPPSRCINQFGIPKHSRPEESNQFAKTIQPILIKLLRENPLSLKYILMCFVSTLSSAKIELTEELAFVLLGFGQIPEASPFVLAALTFFESSPLLAQSHILDYLVSGTLTKQQKGWFTRTINKLRKNVSKALQETTTLDQLTIGEIVSLISNNKISKFEFLNSGIKRLKALFANLEKSPISYQDAKIIADFLLFLLSFANLPTASSDTCIINQFIDEISQTIIIPIEVPIEEGERPVQYLKINRFETVGYVEASFNDRFSETNYGIDHLKEITEMPDNADLKSIILDDSLDESQEDDYFDKISYDQRSIIYRAMDPNYKRLHIEELPGFRSMDYDFPNYGFNEEPPTKMPAASTMPAKKYNSNCSFFYINPRGNTNLAIVDGDCDPIPPFKPKKTYDSLTDICDLLMKLTKITDVGQNIIFSRKIRNLLINPKEGLYHSSLALDTIYLYPFLFPFDIRLFAFKLMAFEPMSAVRAWSNEFSIHNDQLKEVLKSDPLKWTIHRDSIFNDGYQILTNFSQNQMKFEISFLNEEGIGLGPTHEFFTLFSHELCKANRKFFRYEAEKDGICIHKLGMFFTPLCTTQQAALLGRFIAKSIQMECLVDINFNPAMFKLVRMKETVDVKEVDPMLSQSLDHPDGLVGLPFLYPGIESLPLVENGGDVVSTAENLSEFVDLIKDFTCGERMKPLAKSFVEGFDSVFPFTYLDIFDEMELNKIIAGDERLITREELEKNVEISHGYTANSKQIGMLFDIVSDMKRDEQRLFIQFVTGYCQLPIGGLASLKPKLSIAKKVPNGATSPDEPLPSCMTCMNYFKLPPYSSKEIMEQKIRIAIHEGSTSFKLT